MLYNPPSGATGPDDSYVGKDVAAGKQGSKVPRAAVENTQREIVNAITASGQTPSNGVLTQLWQAILLGAKMVINALKIAGGVPQIYATPGSYTLSLAAGVTFAVTECRGAGGGGGGANSQSAAASGGGGGGRAQKTATTLSPTVLAITVGAGGSAGNGGASPGYGGPGGTSSIVIQSGAVVDFGGNQFVAGSTLCAATGGGGGTPSTSGAQSNSRGLGGIASGGDVNDAGDPGGYGYLQGPYIGGVGGASPGGAATQPNFAAYGITSTNPGTGGSGASSNDAGGAGSPGRVTIQHP